MLVKIKNIKTSLESDKTIPYVEGKLILRKIPFSENDYQKVIDCDLWLTRDGKPFKNNLDSFKKLLEERYTPFEPFIISETELVEDNDFYFNEDFKIIYHCGKKGSLGGKEWNDKNGWPGNKQYKILVFPRNFSLKKIEDILSVRLKQGSSVSIECYRRGLNTSGVDSDLTGGILINKDDYFTIKFEEDHSFNILELSWNDILKKGLGEIDYLRDPYPKLIDWLKEYYNPPTKK